MDFIDRLRALSGNARQRVPHARTEEATKNALVMPFLQVLGYDVFDPLEVVPEYVADVGMKRGEKVDYAILMDGDPIIIIECKAVGSYCNINLDGSRRRNIVRLRFNRRNKLVGVLDEANNEVRHPGRHAAGHSRAGGRHPRTGGPVAVSAPHDAIWRRLDERLYDAPTLLRWFWCLQAEDPQLDDPIAWGQLDNLRHSVPQAMSGCFPSSPVPLLRSKPTKPKNRLNRDRFGGARVDDPNPCRFDGEVGGWGGEVAGWTPPVLQGQGRRSVPAVAGSGIEHNPNGRREQ